MASISTIAHALTFRIAPASSLLLGAMLVVACQDSPVAPSAAPSVASASRESRSDGTSNFTTIDIRGALSTTAWGINPRGDIVGTYTDASGRSHGYLLSHGGDTTTIDFSATAFNEARGISPSGEIVGFYREPSEPAVNSHGFLRTKKGDLVRIDDLPHTNTVAQRILPDGTIVGCRHDEDQMSTMRGIVVSTDGSITERSEFGSMHNGATPDLTSIVGQYFNHAVGDRNEGFLIHDGVFTPLFVTVTGTTLTQAWDINSAGEIVGVYRVGTGQTAVFHGFVTTDGATYVTFDVPVPGAKATRLRGINSRGDIVGAYVSADGKTHGFVATR